MKKVWVFLCEWLVRRKVASCGKNLHVNHYSHMTSKTYLGDNVNFNGLNIAGQGEVHIGNNFHSGRNCSIITQNHDYDFGNAIPYGDAYICKAVVIEDNVWIGESVIVLPGAIIHEGAIVQAGSVVVGEVPSCAIVGGHPAKAFKYRNIDHYNKLKEEKKFG